MRIEDVAVGRHQTTKFRLAGPSTRASWPQLGLSSAFIVFENSVTSVHRKRGVYQLRLEMAESYKDITGPVTVLTTVRVSPIYS